MQKATTEGMDKLDECACQGVIPMEVVKQTADLVKVNRGAVAALVREMKRNKTFGRLVAEMLRHDETYGVLARFMEGDERYARRLARAMNEIVAPPAHQDDMEDEDGKPPHPADMEGDDMGDDDMGGSGDMDMGDGDDMGMGDDAGMDDDMGMGDGDDMGMGDDAGMDDDMGMGMGNDDMGGSPHGPGGDPSSDIAPHSKIMPAKKEARSPSPDERHERSPGNGWRYGRNGNGAGRK
jgi:hypothetical protein